MMSRELDEGRMFYDVSFRLIELLKGNVMS